MTQLLQTLLDLELKFWSGAGDPSIYESNFADDGIAVFPMVNGILDKGQILEGISAAKPWKRVQINNERLLWLGDDVVALVYEGVGEREGESPYRALITSVYRNDDGWKLKLHQQTPLA